MNFSSSTVLYLGLSSDNFLFILLSLLSCTC